MQHIEKDYKIFSVLYNDQSKPEIPSRNIKWEFSFPFLLSMNGSLFWKGHSFNIRFLVFGFNYITNVHCGKYIHAGFMKWLWHITAYHGWSFSFIIGVSQAEFLDWKIRRIVKTLSLKEKEN